MPLTRDYKVNFTSTRGKNRRNRSVASAALAEARQGPYVLTVWRPIKPPPLKKRIQDILTGCGNGCGFVSRKFSLALQGAFSSLVATLRCRSTEAPVENLPHHAKQRALMLVTMLRSLTQEYHDLRPAPLGKEWRRLKSMPIGGEDFENLRLKAELKDGRTSFERIDLDGFNLAGLSWDSCIQVKEGVWYQPTLQYARKKSRCSQCSSCGGSSCSACCSHSSFSPW